MPSSFTPNLKLSNPAVNDPGWGPVLDGNFTLLDALAAVGGLAASPHEQPSASLLVDVAPGQFVKRDWSVGTFAGASGHAVPADTTRVLYLDAGAAYALTLGTGYPSTQHVRIATVVSGASTITSVVDNRIPIVVGT